MSEQAEKEQWILAEIEALGTVRLSLLYEQSPWGYNATREAVRGLLGRGVIERSGQGLAWLRRSTKVHEGPRQNQNHTMLLTSKPKDQVLTSSEPLTRKVHEGPRFGSGAHTPTPEERERALAWIRAIRQGVDRDV